MTKQSLTRLSKKSLITLPNGELSSLRELILAGNIRLWKGVSSTKVVTKYYCDLFNEDLIFTSYEISQSCYEKLARKVKK